MRIAGNKVKHLRDFFFRELNNTYEESEIEAIWQTAVESILGFTKLDLLKKSEDNLNQSDLLRLYDCAKDLKKNIPLQYILKEAWFYDLKLHVNANVLIPRPETEELVDLILKENRSFTSLLDIGTGSGCIPVTIKKNRPEASVFAIDISSAALATAFNNAELNKVQISLIEADALNEKELLSRLSQKFQIIVSNPPYIKKTEKPEMHANVVEHEPHLALFVEGEDEIIFYRKIIDAAAGLLEEKGKLYFELNPFTAQAVKEYAEQSLLFDQIDLIGDLSGKTRFMRANRK